MQTKIAHRIFQLHMSTTEKNKSKNSTFISNKRIWFYTYMSLYVGKESTMM